jgi:hypothetical protein
MEGAPVDDRRQHRHQGHREEQRAGERGDHRVRHRREDPPFHPLQEEDRKVGGDDDQQGKTGRTTTRVAA